MPTTREETKEMKDAEQRTQHNGLHSLTFTQLISKTTNEKRIGNESRERAQPRKDIKLFFITCHTKVNLKSLQERAPLKLRPAMLSRDSDSDNEHRKVFSC
jgi:hypothetical protein